MHRMRPWDRAGRSEQILIHTIENVKVPCVVDADGTESAQQTYGTA